MKMTRRRLIGGTRVNLVVLETERLTEIALSYLDCDSGTHTESESLAGSLVSSVNASSPWWHLIVAGE